MQAVIFGKRLIRLSDNEREMLLARDGEHRFILFASVVLFFL